MKFKKLLCSLLLCAVLAYGITVPSLADEITVKVDGRKLELSTPALLENDTAFVPMRAVFEALGMSVEWDGETKTVTASDGEKTVKMTVGKKEIVKDGIAAEAAAAPIISGDTTLVPVRAVSEALDADVEWDPDTKTVVIESAGYQEMKEAWKDNVGSINLSQMTASGEGISVDGKVIKINKGGDFTVTGTNSDAMIHIDTAGRVKLRLSGMSLTNTTGPAIFYENADKAFITLSKDTENFISDGEVYSSDAKAAVFSASDIEIKGGGTLSVTSASHHAIFSKDDIDIQEGTLILNAAKGDGIHANEEIKISGGNITITADGDGIQAEENVVIEGGVIDITTTGEVSEAKSAFDAMNRGQRPFGSAEGEMPEGGRMPRGNMQPPPEGELPQGEPFGGREDRMNMLPPEAEGGMPVTMGDGNFGGERENMQPPQMTDPGEAQETPEGESDTSASSKGIKAETLIEISGGEINVSSTDHAIHCAAAMTVSGGKMTLASRNKGISVHGSLDITDGEITVAKASEGIESKAVMTISGGSIDITASDDGINCGGTGARGANDGAAHNLKISGGNIYVNASGDGLDSNGTMTISGGSIIVEGPTSSGNGALDSERGITISGGTLLAIGASGMAEAPGAGSEQASFSYTLPSGYAAGDKITVTDAEGNVLISYVTAKPGGNIVFSSPYLKVGETYTLTVGENTCSIELTSISTGVGGNSRGFGGKGGRGQISTTEVQRPEF